MIIKNQTAGTISLGAITAAGILGTACAGGTATADQPAEAPAASAEQDAERETVEQYVVKNRIVKAHTTDEGEVKVSSEIVIVDGDDADLDVFGEEGTYKVLKIDRTGDPMMHMTHCVGDEDDEIPPVKFEWKDESEDGERVEISVICLTGEDALPENQVIALEEAIARMEAESAAEQERRARAIEALRTQLDRLKASSE